MNVTVLGCGRWASFLGWYADKLGHHVTIWGRPGSPHLAHLRKERSNEYLTLSDRVVLSDQLDLAVQSADFVIVSIASQQFRSLMQNVRQAGGDATKQRYTLCMKGLEIGTGKRLSQIFVEEMGHERVAVWVGPGHVQSFVKEVPNCMVVDALKPEWQEAVIENFGSELIRFYYGTDLIGTEIGAACKNVVGIAAGMLDGLELTALKGALMARAPREVGRLIAALGGHEQSAYGLAHLGDYEATLFSANSHNRRFGEDFVKNIPFDKLAEGVSTLDALLPLEEAFGVDLPISDCARNIIYHQAEPRAALDSLFHRPIKQEFS